MSQFGKVWGASGVQGFFGEGYWFHRIVPGLNFKGMTFVAKTTTLRPRKGNMNDSFFPKCIIVKPWAGVALNAVGLTGPGAVALFGTDNWQKRTHPFMISFMPIASTRDRRILEALKFARLMREHLDQFETNVGLQINFSCPNTEHKAAANEAREILKILYHPCVKLYPKFNVLFPVEAAIRLQNVCNGLVCSNTIPWGTPGIDWYDLFGSDFSPLEALGGGGLSGAPLLPLVAEWIAAARKAGYTKHINGCGGVMQKKDVDVLASAGADSISLGTVAMLRGWRVASIIRYAQRIL